MTNPLPSACHCTADRPNATSPAPISDPAIACVVETGRPVSVATITHPNAPISTATKNACPSGVPAANRPVLKLLSSPAENQNDAAAPSSVVPVAYASACRGVAAP